MGRASRKRAELRLAPAPVPAAVLRARPRRRTYAQERTLSRLEALVDARRVIERDIDDVALQLVGLGVTYGEIGRALGVSRQAARQRYGG